VKELWLGRKCLNKASILFWWIFVWSSLLFKFSSIQFFSLIFFFLINLPVDVFKSFIFLEFFTRHEDFFLENLVFYWDADRFSFEQYAWFYSLNWNWRLLFINSADRPVKFLFWVKSEFWIKFIVFNAPLDLLEVIPEKYVNTPPFDFTLLPYFNHF
jgi:hypothetical protein